MKKICTILALTAVCGLAQATTLPAPSSLVGPNALDGQDAYSWGISLAAGQTIDSASITFSAVKLTVANSSGTGFLYTDLLNANVTGVHSYSDSDAAGDYFKTVLSGANLTSLGKQFFASVGTTETWTIDITGAALVALNAYAADGIFDIGIDPDCHYNVGGLSFNYTTTTTHTAPDATATAFLLGVSLLGMELLRRQLALRKLAVKK